MWLLLDLLCLRRGRFYLKLGFYLSTKTGSHWLYASWRLHFKGMALRSLRNIHVARDTYSQLEVPFSECSKEGRSGVYSPVLARTNSKFSGKHWVFPTRHFNKRSGITLGTWIMQWKPCKILVESQCTDTDSSIMCWQLGSSPKASVWLYLEWGPLGGNYGKIRLWELGLNPIELVSS